MKKYLLTAVIVALLTIYGQVKAQNPCEETGTNCDYWHNGYTTYNDPINFPGCDIEISYEYKQCDGITYFRLTGISFFWTPECEAVFYYLVPFGNYADGRNLSNLWRSAFGQISGEFFTAYHNQHPNDYICPNTYSTKTITPGGCNSWRWAMRPPGPGEQYSWIHLKYTPCEENGCCVTEALWCWNNNTNRSELVSQTTQYVTGGDCRNKSPLYNPFEGYGPEWIIGPPSPCGLSCYFDN